jgi:hypothetical protein
MTAASVKIEKVGHRPRGSGATTIRLALPTPQQSGRLYIGRALWQAIGEPARVDLLRHGGRLLIVAGETFAVSGRQGSIPRVSIGQPTLETIGLEPGTYPAMVDAVARSLTVAPPETWAHALDLPPQLRLLEAVFGIGAATDESVNTPAVHAWLERALDDLKCDDPEGGIALVRAHLGLSGAPPMRLRDPAAAHTLSVTSAQNRAARALRRVRKAWQVHRKAQGKG